MEGQGCAAGAAGDAVVWRRRRRGAETKSHNDSKREGAPCITVLGCAGRPGGKTSVFSYISNNSHALSRRAAAWPFRRSRREYTARRGGPGGGGGVRRESEMTLQFLSITFGIGFFQFQVTWQWVTCCISA